jgi:hypothetical protein
MNSPPLNCHSGTGHSVLLNKMNTVEPLGVVAARFNRQKRKSKALLSSKSLIDEVGEHESHTLAQLLDHVS